MMTRGATDSAQLCGFSVYWLCSRDFALDLTDDEHFVIPTFSQTMYHNYVRKNDGRLTKLASRVRNKFLRSKSDDKSHAPAVFKQELEAAWERHNISSRDRLFLHTGDGASFRALFQIAKERPEADLPNIHIATPYDPAGVMPNKGDPEDLHKLISELKQRNLIDRRVYLYAENPFLADHLSATWSCPVRTLETPVYEPTAQHSTNGQKFRTERLNAGPSDLVIASLGSARMEKGFYFMPDIIRRTFELAGNGEFAAVDPARIRFVLHASPQIVGRDPAILNAIEKLQALPPQQATLMLEPLSEADYQSLLFASDVVLMPYSEVEYKYRGSTIVSEAIAAGKPIVAKSGSYPAKAAQKYVGGAGQWPIDMAREILNICSHPDQIKAQAQQASAVYLALNRVETYWQKCLDAESDHGEVTGREYLREVTS